MQTENCSITESHCHPGNCPPHSKKQGFSGREFGFVAVKEGLADVENRNKSMDYVLPGLVKNLAKKPIKNMKTLKLYRI